MEFKTRVSGAVEILGMKGRLDLAGAEAAEKFFAQYRNTIVSGTPLVVSFKGVEYISSSGLRVLLSAFKDIQMRGSQLALCEMNVAVEEVFQFAGLDAVFRIHATEAEAAGAVSAAH